MRAYIEAHDEEQDLFEITVHIDKTLVGRVNLDKPGLIWLYTINNEDDDLVINNSAGMEAKKWDHITKEILGTKGKYTWEI
jgi:hypothetical protein